MFFITKQLLVSIFDLLIFELALYIVLSFVI